MTNIKIKLKNLKCKIDYIRC